MISNSFSDWRCVSINRRIDPAEGKKTGNLFKNSVIFSLIDRFAAGIYGLLKNGVFGRLLSAYPSPSETRTETAAGRFFRKVKSRTVLPLRRFVSRFSEESLLFSLVHRLVTFLLRCRLRVYGVLFFTMGVYAAAMYLLPLFGADHTAPLIHLFAAGVLSLASIPLLLSHQSLSEALLGSSFGEALCRFMGIRKSVLRADGHRGRSNVAFILGMVLGLLTYALPFLYLLGLFLAVFLLFRIFQTPEFGVVLLFAAMPFLPTMALAALLVYTVICYLVKLFLGKRRFVFETVDMAALLFAFSVGLSGVFSFSAGSLKPALLQVCFIGGYFLTVLLIRTDEWLSRCAWSAIAAGAATSLFGIYQYFTGTAQQASAWIDSSMFGDISGRVVATLENPNMLAEYLILIFPLAAARFLTGDSRRRRAAAFTAAGLLGLCTVFTWSRGAWLGLIFGSLVLLLIWHRRALYLLFAGVAAIPVLPFVLPDSVLSRFTSIGNLADTSTSYRLNIWRGSIRMLEEHWVSGIGLGEAAWGTVYPRYALAAIETAPHSHNLYLQVWIESGVAGILLLLAFLWLLCQVNFTFFADLSNMRKTLTDAVSVARLKPETAASVKESRTVSHKGNMSAAVSRAITSLRLDAAAPLAGLLATLLQGFTDYTWYNYRVFLMFWLMAGLSAAYVRRGRTRLEEAKSAHGPRLDSGEEGSRELPVADVPREKLSKEPKKGTADHV